MPRVKTRLKRFIHWITVQFLVYMTRVMAILDTNEKHAENTRNKCDKIYEIKSFSCDIKI